MRKHEKTRENSAQIPAPCSAILTKVTILVTFSFPAKIALQGAGIASRKRRKTRKKHGKQLRRCPEKGSFGTRLSSIQA